MSGTHIMSKTWSQSKFRAGSSLNVVSILAQLFRVRPLRSYKAAPCGASSLCFYTSIFWALYTLLFGVSLSSVLKTLPWPIMIYFYNLWRGWSVVSLSLIPHLPIFIIILHYCVINDSIHAQFWTFCLLFLTLYHLCLTIVTMSCPFQLHNDFF